MKIKLPLLLLLFCTAIVSAQPKLYTMDGSRAFYQLDMATGARTLLGTAGAAVGTAAGMAYDKINNILYLTSSGNDAVYTFNRTTMDVTLIGAYGDTAIVMHGLEYHDPSGKLYGMSSHNGGLYEINKVTGVATLVGLSGLASFCNLGWDSVNNVMYATNSGTDSFYSINLTTGVATLIGPMTGTSNPHGMAYDHNLDRLFLIDSSTDNLYTINRTTGAVTSIGSPGSGNYLGLVYINEPLSTDEWSENNLQMYQQNQQIVMDSETNTILSIGVYDITGRSLYQNDNVGASHFTMESGQFGNQILIIKVQTENGAVTKKLVNR